MLALFESFDETRSLPIAVTTISASIAAACFRYLLTPVDTWKSTLQVKGKSGLSQLGEKVEVGGIGSLWSGGAGAVAATFAGHYPWYS